MLETFAFHLHSCVTHDLVQTWFYPLNRKIKNKGPLQTDFVCAQITNHHFKLIQAAWACVTFNKDKTPVSTLKPVPCHSGWSGAHPVMCECLLNVNDRKNREIAQ